MGKHRQYTDEFKHEALRLAETSGKSVSELERDLGLSAGLLHQWQRRYRADETSVAVQPSADREAEAEIRRLKRELEIVRQERDILKKPSRYSHGSSPCEVPVHRRAPRCVPGGTSVPGAWGVAQQLLRLVQAPTECA